MSNFEALASEYNSLLARMVITRHDAVEYVAHKLLGFVDLPPGGGHDEGHGHLAALRIRHADDRHRR